MCVEFRNSQTFPVRSVGRVHSPTLSATCTHLISKEWYNILFSGLTLDGRHSSHLAGSLLAIDVFGR